MQSKDGDEIQDQDEEPSIANNVEPCKVNDRHDWELREDAGVFRKCNGIQNHGQVVWTDKSRKAKHFYLHFLGCPSPESVFLCAL